MTPDKCARNEPRPHWPRLRKHYSAGGMGPLTGSGRERRAILTRRQITCNVYRLEAFSFQDSPRCLKRALCTGSGCSTNGVCPAPEMLRYSALPLARVY